MTMATSLGGAFMYSVHVPAAKMPPAEYGVFLALLQVMNLLLIPAIGLQTIMAQQTAAAVTPAHQRQLAYTVRRLLVAGGLLWLILVAATAVGHPVLIRRLQIVNPASLWLTLGIGLAMLWWPVFQGVLQGQQNFLWLGVLQIVNGLGRLICVLALVWWLGWHAAGAMLAALLGFAVTLGSAAWLTRSVWSGPGEKVAWKSWAARVIPLTLGAGASQFMVAADQILVQDTFSREVTSLYGAAGTIGRALVLFTAAVFAVMFPKVVASRARGESTDVLAVAFGGSAILGAIATTACMLLPALPLKVIYASQPVYWTVAPLIPWFAWCMLPLSLANVLIAHLLARERFRAVPWLILVAAGYGVTLWARQDTLRQMEQFPAFLSVVRTLGGFSLLLLSVAAWFTWGGRWTTKVLCRNSPGADGERSRRTP